MAKALVVYYTRTGTTKKVAEEIAKHLKADIEEIIDTKNRKGVIGYLKSGRDAMRKRLTTIHSAKMDAASYDVVAIGTPIWGWALTPAVRTYINENKLRFKKVAFFCTMGGSGGARAFQDMTFLAAKRPVAVLELKTAEVKANSHMGKVKDFCRKIRQSRLLI